VSVYDSYEYEYEGNGTGKLGWILLGGTSVATPLVAGIEAHATSTAREEGAEAFYRHKLFDVNSGNDGLCGHTYLCEAEEGYDGPTGWGTPDGPLELTPKTSAITTAATSVIATQATLNGYVYTAGLSTTYRFEYGPTTSYGTDLPVPNGSVESGATWQAVSQVANGLHTYGGTYHYRVVATNSSGTVYGADHTFTTIPWTVQTALSPKGSSESGLGSVSCSSAEACMAVGSYDTSLEEGTTRWPLTEQWNGKEWQIRSIQKPAGATSADLSGVSCSSSSECTAVGEYVAGEHPNTLAERWNGTKSEWSPQTTPNPEGALKSYLTQVSCTSSSACTAVGYYENSSYLFQAFAEAWNGKEWEVQTTPGPTGAKRSTLEGVSCVSSTECIAVGYYTNSAGAEVTLAESLKGTEWKVQTPPNPTGVEASYLTGVSCTSFSVCSAVGSDRNSSDVSLPLAERWQVGTKGEAEWIIQTTPTLPGDQYGLSGVSCASSTECIAVGDNGSERWNGVEWSTELIATPEELPKDEYASLTGISCLPSTACIAVGGHTGHSEGGSGEYVPLAESRPLIKPYAETTQATGVSETGATLNGVVDPEGLATKYYFEYGTTTKYGSKTAEATAGAGTSNVVESKAITGLKANTIYHFRIVATSAGGTSDGADSLFEPAGPLKLQPVKGGGAFPVAFTPSGGKVFLESADGFDVTCKSMTGTGSFTSVKEGRVSLKLKECTGDLSTKCSNAAAEEIETKELKSLLAYTYPSKITAEGRETGLVLSPASGEALAEFTCVNAKKTVENKAVVRGSMMAVLSPLAAKTKTLSLTIKQTKAKQEPSEYETESGSKIATGLKCTIGKESSEACGEEATTPTFALTSEEATIEL